MAAGPTAVDPGLATRAQPGPVRIRLGRHGHGVASSGHCESSLAAADIQVVVLSDCHCCTSVECSVSVTVQ
jgi:hypothetical protein